MLTKTFKSIALALALVGVLSNSAAAFSPPVERVIHTPGVYGDQLIFFYDARANRVPILTVSNLAEVEIPVEVAFYSQDLTRTLASETHRIPGYGNVILDPASTKGVKGHAGLAVVTPMGTPPSANDTLPQVNPAPVVVIPELVPVVPPHAGRDIEMPPLFGSFTLANTKLGAGFGQNPMARIAVGPDGTRPGKGTAVDGKNVVYQRVAPDTLVAPVHFNPSRLSPPSKDGNRILIAAFRDVYGKKFRIAPAPLKLGVAASDADGFDTFSRDNTSALTVKGVLFENLQSLARGTILTKSGKVIFYTDQALPLDTNLMGLFSQTLGTFAIGQRMPGMWFEFPR